MDDRDTPKQEVGDPNGPAQTNAKPGQFLLYPIYFLMLFKPWQHVFHAIG
jgi:hypothetical protein